MLSVAEALAWYVVRFTVASAPVLTVTSALAEDTPSVRRSMDALAHALPVSDERLAELCGTGNHFQLSASEQIGAPSQAGVILWDESKSGRPAPPTNHALVNRQTNVVANRR